MPPNKPPEEMTDEELRREVAEIKGGDKEPRFGFQCPKCGGEWFGTNTRGDGSKYRKCHGQFGPCDWRGQPMEAIPNWTGYIGNAWALVEEGDWFDKYALERLGNGWGIYRVRFQSGRWYMRETPEFQSAPLPCRAICEAYMQWKREEAGK